MKDRFKPMYCFWDQMLIYFAGVGIGACIMQGSWRVLGIVALMAVGALLVVLGEDADQTKVKK